MKKMQTIGVLTSGGDAPGMNAAVRAVVRTGVSNGLRVLGVRRGYDGLVEGDFVELGARDVANILQRGGTVLYTARSKKFHTPSGRDQAVENMRQAAIDALVVIGGDGSMRGAHALHTEYDFPVVGLPGTIDNDLFGTDHTIGYFTAIETALEAVDKIRDTSASHQRIFVIEVMGRHAGHIALDVALAGGAEDVFVPEMTRPASEVVSVINESYARGKSSSIIVVAEGYPGGGAAIQAEIESATGHPTRLAVLGHIQRGGSPAEGDRILASRLGVAAVEALLKGERHVMLGMQNNAIVATSMLDTWQKRKPIDAEAYRCLKILST